MGKRTDRAFDIMNERNRRYLEEQKKKDEEAQKSARQDEGALTPEQEEELRQAEEKRRVFQEQNGGGTGVFRYDDPDPDLPESADPDELKEAERKAKEFHEQIEPVKLEKGDIPAMILSAILVFGPIFLVLFGILALAWIFLH